MRCEFDIIFNAESSVTAEQLNHTLLKTLRDSYNCSYNGPDCTVGGLVAVNLLQSLSSGKSTGDLEGLTQL